MHHKEGLLLFDNRSTCDCSPILILASIISLLQVVGIVVIFLIFSCLLLVSPYHWALSNWLLNLKAKLACLLARRCYFILYNDFLVEGIDDALLFFADYYRHRSLCILPISEVSKSSLRYRLQLILLLTLDQIFFLLFKLVDIATLVVV